jgi:lathosterol oxidase
MYFYWDKFLEVISIVGSRYFILATIAFVVPYILFRKQIAQYKIQLRFPTNRDYLREIIYSFSSMFIFALMITSVIFHPTLRSYTKIYTSIADFGWAYYVAIFPLMFFIHDTYFYWLHRFMHQPKVFKWVHLVHHQSTNPSPWVAYAFHPSEAILENGIVLLFFFAFPVHATHVPIFFLFSIIYNIYGHLGWEIYPKGFNTSLVGRWVNTGVAHNQHHKFFKGNYGLYLLFWDRMMGTIRPDYDEAFDKLKNRPN